MKQIFILTATVLLVLNSLAQTVVNPYPKTISVTGSAEMEVVPDEIYVQVDLKEYDKKGTGKIGIEQIKQDFLKKARSTGIPDSMISIASYDGNTGNYWIRKKAKKDELYASISYLIKLRTGSEIDKLVDILDDNATQNFFVQKTENSRIAEYRKQLKIEAIKAAKDKAQYLAAAIGDSISVAVTINEPVEYYTPYINRNYTANVAMQRTDASDDAEISFKKTKLKYDVTVVFALK